MTEIPEHLRQRTEAAHAAQNAKKQKAEAEERQEQIDELPGPLETIRALEYLPATIEQMLKDKIARTQEILEKNLVQKKEAEMQLARASADIETYENMIKAYEESLRELATIDFEPMHSISTQLKSIANKYD